MANHKSRYGAKQLNDAQAGIGGDFGVDELDDLASLLNGRHKSKRLPNPKNIIVRGLWNRDN